MAESTCRSEVNCFFSFYVYIPYYFYEVSLHILHLKNKTNVPFDLIKNLLPFALTAKLHVDAAIFIS